MIRTYDRKAGRWTSQGLGWTSPLGLVVVILVFGFVLIQASADRGRCEATCKDLGFDHMSFVPSSKTRAESCRCCDREWTPQAVCTDARNLAALAGR